MAFKKIRDDIQGFLMRDPAARNALEVALCYPGFHALVLHRLSHWLWGLGLKLPARLLGMVSRFLTGIEIHPGATIGAQLVIDHGMGVVIGETATIGDRVTIYHDVTLGGTSLKRELRHPQVGDDVIIGAGAQLLGPIAIGDGARVGSNAVVVRDVPPGATVVGVPARQVGPNLHLVEADDSLEGHVFAAYGTPRDEDCDPVQREMAKMRQEMARLQAEFDALKEARGDASADDARATAAKWEGNV